MIRNQIHFLLFKVKVVKGGPAFTLKIYGSKNNETVNIDVDLVPCFVFTDTRWPCSSSFRQNPFKDDIKEVNKVET